MCLGGSHEMGGSPLLGDSVTVMGVGGFLGTGG